MKTFYALIFMNMLLILFSSAAISGDTFTGFDKDINIKLIKKDLIMSESVSVNPSQKSENNVLLPVGQRLWERKLLKNNLLAEGNTGSQSVTNSPNNYSFAPNIAKRDDNGESITEEEIRAYMKSNYSIGCCLLGGIVGSAASLLLGCAASASIDNNGEIGSGIIFAIWGVGTGVSAWGGYKAGREIERRRAIELIMEERRTGKVVPTPESYFSSGVIGVF